jgi:endoglucanase
MIMMERILQGKDRVEEGEETRMTINGKIHVNQVGYRTSDRKVAVINGSGGIFEVADARSGKMVFRSKTSGPIEDAMSGDTVYHADFSSVSEPGEYFVSVPGFGKSYNFSIGNHIYRDIKNAFIKGFYFQRCGVRLEEKHAGPWKHAACHLQEGIVYSSDKRLDGAGGWHDAGDYGKYPSPAATTLGHLLLAYELFSDAFQEQIHIPESGNGVPDLLNECRFELEWLFKMQDSETGGVYHKLTTWSFPDMELMPEDDRGELVFSPVSPTATASVAAIMAVASRVYGSYDVTFADQCLKAAEKAWGWLVKNPEIPGFKNPPGIVTGEYGDDNDRDERFWAAAELYRTTGGKEYHNAFTKAYREGGFDMTGFGWTDTGGFGAAAYLFCDRKDTDTSIRQNLKNDFVQKAEALLATAKADGYSLSLKEDGYIWGSSMVLMNNAIQLILAHLITTRDEFVQSALEHFHCLLGCNPMDQCYVTGFGSKPILYPHHRPSVGDGVKEPVPGLVSGGPDKDLQDDFAKSCLQGMPPARCFVDDAASYSTNEITIYWNSPAVFVAGYFDRHETDGV